MTLTLKLTRANEAIITATIMVGSGGGSGNNRHMINRVNNNFTLWQLGNTNENTNMQQIGYDFSKHIYSKNLECMRVCVCVCVCS